MHKNTKYTAQAKQRIYFTKASTQKTIHLATDADFHPFCGHASLGMHATTYAVGLMTYLPLTKKIKNNHHV